MIMMNKKIMAIAAVAALTGALALAGCASGQAASSSASSAESSAASSAAASSASSAESSAASSAPASSAASSAPAAESSAPAASNAPADVSSYIGDQAALEIALGDAGFASADVIEIEVELDLDDPVANYDISFKQGGLDYDYEVDATSGAILKATSEPDD